MNGAERGCNATAAYLQLDLGVDLHVGEVKEDEDQRAGSAIKLGTRRKGRRRGPSEALAGSPGWAEAGRRRRGGGRTVVGGGQPRPGVQGRDEEAWNSQRAGLKTPGWPTWQHPQPLLYTYGSEGSSRRLFRLPAAGIGYFRPRDIDHALAWQKQPFLFK